MVPLCEKIWEEKGLCKLILETRFHTSRVLSFGFVAVISSPTGQQKLISLSFSLSPSLSFSLSLSLSLSQREECNLRILVHLVM